MFNIKSDTSGKKSAKLNFPLETLPIALERNGCQCVLHGCSFCNLSASKAISPPFQAGRTGAPSKKRFCLPRTIRIFSTQVNQVERAQFSNVRFAYSDLIGQFFDNPNLSACIFFVNTGKLLWSFDKTKMHRVRNAGWLGGRKN